MKQGLGCSKARGRVTQKKMKVEETGTIIEDFHSSKDELKETAGTV